MAGHKISHTQLERYRLIDALLSDGGAVSFAGLLSHLRARLRDDTLSESSVRRDLRYMRDALGAPLCYDSARRLWCYTKPFKFPSESFTDDEALALHLLQKLVQQHAPTDALCSSCLALLEKLAPKAVRAPAYTAEAAAAQDAPAFSPPLYERFFVPARPKPLLEEGVSEKVLHALKNNFLLDFTYHSIWEPEQTHRKVLPYQLVLDAGSLYLYGANRREPHNPRLFNLSKMHNVQVIADAGFALPACWHFREDFERGRFGAFQYDECYEFKIAFYESARAAVREYVWADDQVLEEDAAEGRTLLTFTSSQWIPIQRWVLSFGGDAVPLAPDWFVEAWRSAVHKMAARAPYAEP